MDAVTTTRVRVPHLHRPSTKKDGLLMKQSVRKKFSVSTKYGLMVEVEELVFYYVNADSEDIRHRVVWTRFPFDDTNAGGFPNPCIYCDFPTNNGPRTEDEAREVTKKSFYEYYRI